MMDTAHCSCIVKIWAMLLLLLLLLSQSKYSVYHILKSHADNGGDNLLLWTRWPAVEQHCTGWGLVALLLLRVGFFSLSLEQACFLKLDLLASNGFI